MQRRLGRDRRLFAPSLSPDGTSILYITPGPGPKTFVVISNLTTGKTDVVTAADGNPDVIRWCNYAAIDRIVCRVTEVTPKETDLIGFERLIAFDTDGKNPKILGRLIELITMNISARSMVRFWIGEIALTANC